MASNETALDRLQAAHLAGPSVPTTTSYERALICPCGCTEAHVIATRESFDGAKLSLWSDGAITHGRCGTYLRGLGNGRSRYARRVRALAVRLVADDLCIFTAAEIPAVIKAAEGTYAHDYSSETDRRNHALAIARRRLDRKAVPS